MKRVCRKQQISEQREYIDMVVNNLSLMESIPDNNIRVTSSPHPFKIAKNQELLQVGMSLQQVFEIIQPDEYLRAFANICLNDEYIDREKWERTFPQQYDIVVINVVPMGGGGGGGKNILRTVSMLAVTVVAFAFGQPSGFLAGKIALGLGVTTATAAGIATAAIGGISMLAVNTLVAPQRVSSPGLASLTGTSASFSESPTLFIEGARNSFRPFSPVPVVLGFHKHVGPLGAKVFTEIVGDDQHLTVYVIWGYGRLDISDLKIGTTPIANFDDVQIETKEGVSGDSDMSLYPDSVTENNFSIELFQVDSWSTRNTTIEADEISVDIVFFSGLAAFSPNDGTRDTFTVTLEIEYRKVGDVSWLTPTFTAKSVADSAIVGSAISFTDASKRAVRFGFRWAVSEQAEYEVRIRRTTADEPATTIFDEATWTTLRSIKNVDPVAFTHPLAKTVIKIKATDQLNRIVDDLNATVKSYALDFDGVDTWAEGITNNPASLFRHVLQGVANEGAVADSRIDLVSLEAWWTFCNTNSLKFNMVRDFKSSVYETLSDIAAAGRATVAQVDGKWGVVIDQDSSIPTQHFTPRNSWGFEAEKTFVDVPHGLRMRFANELKEYKSDEIIVYDDGYSISNATLFEQVDAIGMTDSDQVWKQGRFFLAEIRLRPETWTFNVDFEHIVSSRGDMVKITHDVLLVGLKSGRIKALQTDANGDVTGFTSDEVLTMEAAKSYGVSIRTFDDKGLEKTITLNVGDQTTIVFDTVIAKADAPLKGDLFGFGLVGSETIKGKILTIEPQSDFTARLVVTPLSSAIYSADTGTIPAFDSKVTSTSGLPDVNITNTRTDESALLIGSGDTLTPTIAIEVTPIADKFNATLNAQIKLTASTSDYRPATISSVTNNEIVISDVEQGSTYDVRLQWTDPSFLLNGDFSNSNGILVIGQTTAPDPLSNMTIQAFGGSALISWDTPPALDVKFGGTVVFRHSHETDSANASWSESVTIGTTAKGSALIAQMPLKPGTYLARVFDKGGRPSTVTKIDTKQASVLTYANVDTVVEETAFSGTHTNTTAPDGILKLAAAGLMDTWADVDLVVDWDSEGGMATSGTYDFAANLDLTTVKKVRLTTNLNVVITGLIDQMDSWPDGVDDREDWDGSTTGAADAQVQVRVTDDDPAASPTWSAWNDLDAAEYTARGFDFRIQLTTADTSFNILISKLQIIVEEIT
ncbi:hypothetical protein HOD41_00840 [bacterium]|nr:hypothetical protein [bacterium]